MAREFDLNIPFELTEAAAVGGGSRPGEGEGAGGDGAATLPEAPPDHEIPPPGVGVGGGDEERNLSGGFAPPTVILNEDDDPGAPPLPSDERPPRGGGNDVGGEVVVLSPNEWVSQERNQSINFDHTTIILYDDDDDDEPLRSGLDVFDNYEWSPPWEGRVGGDVGARAYLAALDAMDTGKSVSYHERLLRRGGGIRSGVAPISYGERSAQEQNLSRSSGPMTIILDDDDLGVMHVPNGAFLEQPSTNLDTNLSNVNGHDLLNNNQSTKESEIEMDEQEKDREPESRQDPKDGEGAKIRILICGVCLGTLVDPVSTFCGHVFCEACLKAAIELRKKCPSCGKRLNPKRRFHRIYLPI